MKKRHFKKYIAPYASSDNQFCRDPNFQIFYLHTDCPLKQCLLPLSQVTSRGDTISYAVLAEMDTFEADRLPDYRDIFKSFLQEQIGFHQKVLRNLFCQ